MVIFLTAPPVARNDSRMQLTNPTAIPPPVFFFYCAILLPSRSYCCQVPRRGRKSAARFPCSYKKRFAFSERKMHFSKVDSLYFTPFVGLSSFSPPGVGRARKEK